MTYVNKTRTYRRQICQLTVSYSPAGEGTKYICARVIPQHTLCFCKYVCLVKTYHGVSRTDIYFTYTRIKKTDMLLYIL